MRIEAYSQVAKVYGANQTVGKTSASKTAAGRDEVQISSFGHDYQVAKQAVADTPDMRQQRVSEVAAKVNSGRYEVSAEDFAAKLLDKYRLFMI